MTGETPKTRIRFLTSDIPTISVGKKGKKSKPNDGIDNQTDKDFEDFRKAMQPRTGKGPSWTNESQPQYHTSAKVEKVNPKDDQIDVNPAPPQDVLSDLEWMTANGEVCCRRY